MNIFDGIILDRDIPSRFPMNNSVETMMKELLLEDWTKKISYDDFFQKCAPLFCTYTVEQRFDAFFVIVTMIGLYGTLNKGLRIILPVLVTLILFLWRKTRHRTQVSPIIQLRQSNNIDGINGE
jgi:hypothetical protein